MTDLTVSFDQQRNSLFEWTGLTRPSWLMVNALKLLSYRLRKQPTFRDATGGFPRFWETASAEIPNWWRAATQIWIVPLIGWKIASSNKRHYPDLGSDVPSVWNFCACFFRRHFPGKHRNVRCFLRLLSDNVLYNTRSFNWTSLPHLCVPLQCRILVHSNPNSFQSTLVLQRSAELFPASAPHTKPAKIDLVLNIVNIIT